jgi:hypothetical protein
MKTRPFIAHQAQGTLSITITPVNDKPYLIMKDTFGNKLESILSVLAIQKVWIQFPPLAVVDGDAEDTKDAKLELSLSVKGGVLKYDKERVDALLSPSGNKITVKGSVKTLNYFLTTIQYQSDAQFIGSDQLFVEIDDLGQTGQLMEGDSVGSASEYVGIEVIKQAKCNFRTCLECTTQVASEDACGWCPSSCNDVGKCRPAIKDRSLPLYGLCNPSNKGWVWNQCKDPPDVSWIKSAVGAPLVLIFMIFMQILIMWSKKMHGNLPTYTRRVLGRVLSKARVLNLLPPAEASNMQIIYVVLLVLAGIFLPSIISTLITYPPLLLQLGEADYFALHTDGCDIKIKSGPQNAMGRQQPSILAQITSSNTSGNRSKFLPVHYQPLCIRSNMFQRAILSCFKNQSGNSNSLIIFFFGTLGLSDVVLETSTCGDTQYLSVLNTRISSEKYKGYSCKIDLIIPQPVRQSLIPVRRLFRGTAEAQLKQNHTCLCAATHASVLLLCYVPHKNMFVCRIFLSAANLCTMFDTGFTHHKQGYTDDDDKPGANFDF